MPGGMYEKSRVASTKYETGSVSQGNKQKGVSGSESYKPKRAGKSPSETGSTSNPPKRAGK